MSLCESPETSIKKLIKFKDILPITAKCPIYKQELEIEVEIGLAKINFGNCSLVEFKVLPFVDREQLIKETAIYGNLNNIALTKEESPIALFALLHFDVEDNYLERLYVNYKLICKLMDINLLYYYHCNTELKLTEIYQINCNADTFPVNPIPNVLPFLKVLFSKLDIYIECTFPSMESFKCEMWCVFYYKVKTSFPDYLITPHDFGLNYGLTKYQIDTFLSEIDENMLDTYIRLDEYDNQDWILFVKRLQYLENKAPIYFKHLCSIIKIPKYTSYNLKEEIFVTYYISKQHLHGILLKDVYLFSRCAWNIYNLPSKEEIAYYLGFDPRKGTLGIDCIKNALLQLSKLGLSKYCYTVLKDTTVHSHFTDTKCSPTYCEYFDFDVISIYEDDLTYYINRSSFKDVLQSKKNPHTGKDLSSIVLREIHHRNSIAYINNLPECLPMRKLLNKMDNEQEPSLYSLLGMA